MKMAQSNPTNVIRFLHVIENLKRTKRTGWLDNGIQQAESISDHMHRMGVMAMLVNDPSINREKCIKMAIVHDLAEAVVGDITPHAGVSKEEKFRLEKNAMDGFKESLGNTETAKEIVDLWLEYEDAKTPEALFVKDLDKFEMIVQALEYEKSDKKKLQGFFDSTKGKFQHPAVKAWAEALYKEREEVLKQLD
ncbi:HD domain-containing protein [Cokeromyces recurvatus]|uniref:HD domain-containing protein n=1 Tax=Cokeromyces recurvatus TaxID=90255 RepID=UPI002220F017|nr:HD domain-containing protein [Cokeromyces recurvatus]KAI7901807.1 HD domain-containing protein [Cokeromyces recurvatus]